MKALLGIMCLILGRFLYADNVSSAVAMDPFLFLDIYLCFFVIKVMDY